MEQEIKSKRNNKSSGYSEVININLAEKVKLPKNVITTIGNYVDFDTSGDYTRDIEEMLLGPLHASIVESKINMIFGPEILYNENNKQAQELIDNYNNQYDLNFILKMATRDLVIWGGFYLLFRFNALQEIAEVEYLDFKNVRVVIDSGGDIVKYLYNVDFDKRYSIAQSETLEFAKFDRRFSKKLSAGGVTEQVYHFYENKNGGVYPIPSYYAMKNYIKLDTVLADFHFHNTLNSFIPSLLVKFPNQPSAKKRAATVRNFRESFENRNNGAGKAVITFNSTTADGSEQSVEIEPFSTTGNADIYKNLQDTVLQRVCSQHHIPPSLLGYIGGSLSIAGSSEEIANYYELLTTNVTDIKQRTLKKTLDMIAKYNNIENPGFTFKSPVPKKFRLNQQLVNAYTAGILTREEVRAIAGLDDIEFGNGNETGGNSINVDDAGGNNNG